ncbi:MAG: SRPBCC family protein [Acidobacteria bacterium]|nr:SRPBCC family protein [Acidobacteriota bacterium]
MWSDVENVPQWQEQIVQVTRTGPRTSHWTMRAADRTIEWNSEILAAVPGRRLAWRTVDGDVMQAGEVVFEPAPGNRGTLVTLLQEFQIGKLANAIASLVSRNPKQTAIENLRHFKSLAETGEIPRTQGQSHGTRGTVASTKESMYGEHIPTPPGSNSAVHAAGGE